MSQVILPEDDKSKQQVVPEELETEQETGVLKKAKFDKEAWKPKTELGRMVRTEEIKGIDQILNNGIRFLEPEIVDIFLSDLESDLLAIGQSKGKFGGGKRSIWKQTQKKTREGNKPKFSAAMIVGNRNGYVGLGFGKSKETVPAREKALRKAKLNLIAIKRRCGSWECGCNKPHSIPFKISGKNGSVLMHLMPAPRGTGLVIEKECKKILEFAGIKDVYSKTFGHTKTKQNLIVACFNALKELNKIKTK